MSKLLKNCFTCEHFEIIGNNSVARACYKGQIEIINIEEIELEAELYLRSYKSCYEPKQT